jgi:hypothetical protein
VLDQILVFSTAFIMLCLVAMVVMLVIAAMKNARGAPEGDPGADQGLRRPWADHQDEPARSPRT